MKKFFSNLSPRTTRLFYSAVSLTVFIVCTLNFSYVMVFNASGNDQCAWRAIAGRDSALLITDVVPGGVADVAGIKNGDILLSGNLQRILSSETERCMSSGWKSCASSTLRALRYTAWDWDFSSWGMWSS
jgi:hypothetical protein